MNIIPNIAGKRDIKPEITVQVYGVLSWWCGMHGTMRPNQLLGPEMPSSVKAI